MRRDRAMRQVDSIDRLPVENFNSSTGHRSPLTAAERALLNSLMPRIDEQLDGDGVTVGYMVERSGLGTIQCTQWLEEQGAKLHKWKQRWRRPRIPVAGYGWRG